MDKKASWFKCTKAAPSSPFTVGVAYEVHSYTKGQPLVMTDGPKMLLLPQSYCEFEPYDPWASYHQAINGARHDQ